MHGSQRSVHFASVTPSVCVPKDEPRRHAPIDEQAPAVQGLMMRPAKNDEPVVIVIAAFRAGFQVVNVDERGVTTAGHDAAAMITTHDFAPSRGRNVLMGALGWIAHVGGAFGANPPHMLRIALRHVDDLDRHSNLLAAPVLPTPSARVAHGERNLVARTPFVARTAQHLARQEEQRSVVVQRLTRFAP